MKQHISCILIARGCHDFSMATTLTGIIDEIVTTKLVMRGSGRALLGLWNNLPITTLVYLIVIVSSTTEERYAWCIPQKHLAMTAFLTLTVVKELSTELRGSTRQKHVGYSAIATLLCYWIIASPTTLSLSAR